jgi:2'-5' RNA ligase
MDDSFLPFIQDKLAKIAESHAPITIDIDSIGHFYDKKRQRVKVIYAVPKQIPKERSVLCT